MQAIAKPGNLYAIGWDLTADMAIDMFGRDEPIIMAITDFNVVRSKMEKNLDYYYDDDGLQAG